MTAPPQTAPANTVGDRLRRLPRWARLGLFLLGCGGVALAVMAADDDAPRRMLTPTEAACDLLRDGSSPDQAYAILVDVLEDRAYTVPDAEATARSAVDRAVAGDC